MGSTSVFLASSSSISASTSSVKPHFSTLAHPVKASHLMTPTCFHESNQSPPISHIFVSPIAVILYLGFSCFAKKRNKNLISSKRTNKGKMAKGKKMLMKLVSAAGTGFFYVKRKNPRVTEKLEFRKFDPRVNKHVLFKEEKIK